MDTFTTGPMEIRLVGLQNQNVDGGGFSQIDPRGPMDVSFGLLEIEADQIKGIIPEPTTITLLSLGLAALGFRLHRSKKAA